jgi:osmotically-inducible protein OsmY
MKASKSLVTTVLAAALLAGGACSTDAVRHPTEVTNDNNLTARVKTALVSEPGVKSTDINVTTFRGVVSLSGFVESPEMAEKAISAASRVTGVRSVTNDMQVKPTS